ncbi:ABC-type antimicrobial peptide transport system, ATPase component [Methanoculleus bourgensis MS2]|uniref:ABC-type antimicrobial peptide transport system, ATPase component n=1 Tax=Methanoculleus bourgensis (strain ATCC 43281 / DSM 3045 / OCM 15 / MS2) TaxID=1201294 RepID=I7KCX5_METBM|nr:ABC transporter ATP-binding protein [Methanoculleus bourgensis]CCJ36331.1 ABC-type antimicrobial peptide transport system, ATPase component [Methanoculleus bourgensis MS2]SAI87337.1 ABC-type antimicrobial peptide transport system, ATPase component [Methanoculleus bourgensis]
MIVAENLTRVYTMGRVEVRALAGVSLEVAGGEFVGIMGASGSGKSTLMHILGLLDRPTSGSVMIDGTDVLALSDHQRTLFRLNRLGYVFQDYALIGELTALENVYLTSLVRGARREEYLRRSAEILERVGLGDRMDHRQSELSGGEQQRVAIARALVNNPSILLADEPCANLDSQTSRSILDLFARLNEDLDQTIVMVSHEEWHKEYFCRVVTLRDGLISGMEECRRRTRPAAAPDVGPK